MICMEQQSLYNRLDEVIDTIINDQVNFNLARMGIEGITAKMNNI